MKRSGVQGCGTEKFGKCRVKEILESQTNLGFILLTCVALTAVLRRSDLQDHSSRRTDTEKILSQRHGNTM